MLHDVAVQSAATDWHDATAAVGGKIPADRPPAPDDCEVYSFWIASSTAYGCS